MPFSIDNKISVFFYCQYFVESVHILHIIAWCLASGWVKGVVLMGVKGIIKVNLNPKL